MSPRKSLVRFLSVLVAMSFIAAACGGSSAEKSDNAAAQGDGLGVDPEAIIDLETVPTADPSIFVSPTEDAESDLGPDEVFVLTAKDDATVIDTFHEPNGESFQLEYQYLDGSKIDYPLTRDTVFGNRLALQVVEGTSNDTFVKVKLPVRPNGTEAWVQSDWFIWNRVNSRVVIDIGHNTIQVYKGSEVVGESEAAVGREGAETPELKTFIDEKIEQADPSGGYGPWIISLAAFSDTLQDYEGKLPKLAIHGTNQPDLIGDEVSAGCIRVHNDFITMIAEDVPVGATVEIINSSSAA